MAGPLESAGFLSVIRAAVSVRVCSQIHRRHEGIVPNRENPRSQ